ncbi:MAG TPA: acylphosphatase [Alphaproteobacteria bacterium]|nr:acylphosphatase [Alphaproteobacteria bacterium]
MPAERTVRVVVRGEVQGVGYRAWTEGEALSLGLDGWVRNRRDGTVEAVFSGEAAAVQRILEACRDGPPAAIVTEVEAGPAAAVPPPGFRILPTA